MSDEFKRGMMRAAEICDETLQAETMSKHVNQANCMMARTGISKCKIAILQAADQVNADGHYCEGMAEYQDHSASQPEAMVADPRVGRWTLTSPDGRMFFGDSQLAALREERNSRMSAAEQLENIRKGMESEIQPDTVAVPREDIDLFRALFSGFLDCPAKAHGLSLCAKYLKAAQEAK